MKKIFTAVLMLSTFCFGVYAQTDPQVKVVVIPLGGDEAAKEKVIFITKDAFPGDLGGLDGADAKCQADADAPDSKVKGKTFKAWLGPASDVLAGDRQFNVFELPYVTPNGDSYIASYSTLISSQPWPFLSIGSSGTDVTSPAFYDDIWTGRWFSGISFATNCSLWTSQSSMIYTIEFKEDSSAARVYSHDPHKYYCAPITPLHRHLACFEQ